MVWGVPVSDLLHCTWCARPISQPGRAEGGRREQGEEQRGKKGRKRKEEEGPMAIARAHGDLGPACALSPEHWAHLASVSRWVWTEL